MCAKIYECGAFMHGEVLVTVTMISWFEAVCILSLLPKCRVLWALGYRYTYFVLVGRWLWIVIGM